MIAKPPCWTHEEFEEQAAISREIFRRQRIDEPLAHWQMLFDSYVVSFTKLLDEYGMIDPSTVTANQLVLAFRDGFETELRYFAGPPISSDDLTVLSESSLAPSVLAADNELAKRVLATIVETIDPKRFPWVLENRQPTELEKHAAIFASASLLTRQKVQTDRANDGKNSQETCLKSYLTSIGLVEEARAKISTLGDAPPKGHFCAEALVGSRKADVPVSLYDGRLLPIECKVSNSSTNSVKRLNNDAAVKAAIWLREFGTNQIVPAAVLSGVFKVHNLIQAQNGGLTIFWAHKLEDLKDFIEATRSGR